jgi:hypothetical protein
MEQTKALWLLLEEFQDIFAWHKGELGKSNIGEHTIDTQRLPPRRMSSKRLSCWEEVEVNMQIQALVDLGKMCKNSLKYACRVTLLMKKDDIRRFCGDYKPLNVQTW